MQKRVKKLLPLLLIIIFGAFIRINEFGKTPDSMNWDEVAISYNAWSISQTGKDEYGNYFPLVFRSFDDYKPPLYIYLTVPFVLFFGPIDYVSRIPNLILGILSIVGIFLLGRKLFDNHKVAVISAFIFATLPWAIHFSRVGFEANSLIFFTIFGWYFFEKFINKSSARWLIMSVIFFLLGLYAYHSAKLVIPLFVLILCIFQIKKILLLNTRVKISLLLLSGILLLPIFYSTFFLGGQNRFDATTVFSKKNLDNTDPLRRLIDIESNDIFSGKIYHNTTYYQVERFVQNYFSHYTSDFLLFTQDNPRHHATRVGVLLLAQCLALIIGLLALIVKKNKKTSKISVLSLFAISPLASAITLESPHSIRSSIIILPITLLCGLGVYRLYEFSKTRLHVPLILFILLYSFNFYFFIHQYFVHYNYEAAEFWQYGRKEAALFTKSIETNYDEIWISNSLEQSYIYWLYYQKISPDNYVFSGGTKSGYQGFNGNSYGKYKFMEIDPNKIESDKKILIVGLKDEFTFRPIKQIKNPSGSTLIEISDNLQHAKD